MSTLTKEELKNALINHGAPVPPTSAKKEEFIQAYEEHVAPLEAETNGFSSDEEESRSPSMKKTSSRSKLSTSSSKLSTSSRKSSGSPKKINKVVVKEAEDIEMTVDITSLDDDQLFEMLKQNGVDPGPIVGSTRKFYEKKLSVALSGGTNNTTEDREFSADDTEPEPEEEEDDQPAVEVVPQRRSNRSLNASSPLGESGLRSPLGESGLRQRLTLTDELETSPGLGSPRRAIHSYTVTETTRQVTTRAKDGTETVDTKHSVERSESDGSPPPKQISFCSRFLYTLIKLIIVSILLFGLYVVFTTPSDGVTPVDKVIETINNAIPPADEVEKVDFEAPIPTAAPPVMKPAVKSVEPLPDAGNVVDV